MASPAAQVEPCKPPPPPPPKVYRDNNRAPSPPFYWAAASSPPSSAAAFELPTTIYDCAFPLPPPPGGGGCSPPPYALLFEPLLLLLFWPPRGPSSVYNADRPTDGATTTPCRIYTVAKQLPRPATATARSEEGKLFFACILIILVRAFHLRYT